MEQAHLWSISNQDNTSLQKKKKHPRDAFRQKLFWQAVEWYDTVKGLIPILARYWILNNKMVTDNLTPDFFFCNLAGFILHCKRWMEAWTSCSMVFSEFLLGRYTYSATLVCRKHCLTGSEETLIQQFWISLRKQQLPRQKTRFRDRWTLWEE